MANTKKRFPLCSPSKTELVPNRMSRVSIYQSFPPNFLRRIGGHKNSVYKAKLKKAKEPQGRPPRAPSGREEKKEKKKETKDEAEGGSSQLASGGKARGKSKEGSSGRSRSRSRSCSRKEADDKEKGKDAEGKSTEKEGTIVGVKLQHNWVHDIWGLDWDGKSKPTKYKDPLSFSIATLVDDVRLSAF